MSENVTIHPMRESWLTVRIETKGDCKFVTIVSSLHVNREFTLPHCYGLAYSDHEILRDSDFLKYYARFR